MLQRRQLTSINQNHVKIVSFHAIQGDLTIAIRLLCLQRTLVENGSYDRTYSVQHRVNPAILEYQLFLIVQLVRFPNALTTSVN